VTPDPTPTQEVSQHQLCVRQGQGDCYVNINPLLLGGSITHTFVNGRYVAVPEGYRPKLATSPAPFVYCKPEYRGCQIEFHWLAGSFGFQAEEVTLYPDTVYLIKMLYTMNAACAPGNTCSAGNISEGAIIFINDNYRVVLTEQPVETLSGPGEAVWAIRVAGTEPMLVDVQAFFSVQWAVFAEPAKVVIHQIGVIAQPSDYQGYIYPVSYQPIS
jgi:hypothetical protein